MQKIVKKNNGYILIFTLLITAATTAVVTYIFNRGIVYVPFMQLMIDQEKAKIIALSGIQVIASQLTYQEKEKREPRVEKKTMPNQDNNEKKLLARILPTLNRWQTFQLKENIEGIDAQLQVCLMSEEGKINLNKIYDFSQHKFRGQEKKQENWKKILQEVFNRIEKINKGKDLFSSLEKFLSKQQQPLNDVTELLAIKSFITFKNDLFYDPPNKLEKKKRPTKQPLYLTDIFTTSSSKATLEPWLFSDSLDHLFGLKQAEFGDIKQRKKIVNQWLKNFKKTAKWKQDWNTQLKPVYEKELQSLPQSIDSILSTTFEPKMFSILSYATVGSVTQRLFVVVERIKSSQNGQTVYDIKIRKLYWL
ncbi:MAG TPA: hypothetical protein ENI08_02505 [Candidatus Dependentiae bacterium]|nr:hypothetical protein [Candidatus Dependentiae bacterium]